MGHRLKSALHLKETLFDPSQRGNVSRLVIRRFFRFQDGLDEVGGEGEFRYALWITRWKKKTRGLQPTFSMFSRD
jgi:hypothetical protein